MRDGKTAYRHGYHDFYSKTYPRYQGYSERENRQDLVDLIETIYDNKKIEFEQELYETPEGKINPNFSYHVNQVVSSNMVCGDLCVIVQNIALDTVTTPTAICAITDRIDIDKIYGNQDQLCAGNNDTEVMETVLGFVYDDAEI